MAKRRGRVMFAGSCVLVGVAMLGVVMGL